MTRKVLLALAALVALATVPVAAGGAEHRSEAAMASTSPAPPLPRILSASVVTGTKYGKAVRVSYCYRSLPTEPAKRPYRLHLTMENLSDGLPPLTIPWRVIKRCATVNTPVGGIKPPYLLRYSTESRRGTWSKQAQMRVR